MWSKVGFMGIKLDMSKAYDRVEWAFLEAVMVKMGFSRRWIDMIMECVKTVSYAVLVNGSPMGHIIPSRGLRQGDPLSPYLFIICAEALSAMLRRAESKGVITGVPTSKNGPRISHLFFADDSLLFCKANMVEWRRLTKILDKYEEASGQKLNKEKTSLFFSRNTPMDRRAEISQLLGLPASNSYDKYLGLPTLVGKSRVQAFKSIKDRVWNCIHNWKVKFLSQAGKEVLLKAVAQAIPTYCMSVFKLPGVLCKEINGMMQKFWWGHKENTSKIHWMSWERMGRSKANGGLGFRDLVIFNKALLAKQLWRLLQNPESLVSKIFKAKYFPNASILEATVGKRPSFVWRSIISAKPVLIHGLMWRIGDGNEVRIWGDRWIPRPCNFAIQSLVRILQPQARVVELIDQDMKRWNGPLVDSIFQKDEADLIKNIPLSPLAPKDCLIWRCTSNGEFTVRSAYHMEMEMEALKGCGGSGHTKENLVWKACWNLKVPNVIKMFLWKACQNLLPTKVNLYKRGVTSNSKCPLCEREEETVEHILWSCASAQDVWGGGKICFQKRVCEESDFIKVVETIMGRCEMEDLELFATTARLIWLRRNTVIHGGIFTHPNQVVRNACRSLEEFRNANEAVTENEEISRPLQCITWQPPSRHLIKVNWDAAVSKEKGCVGVGIIARDFMGRVCTARSLTIGQILDPAAAEAMAGVYAMMMGRELSCEGVILEGDAQLIVKAINMMTPCRGKYGHFIEDIQVGIRMRGNMSVIHTPREGNYAAHGLAQYATKHVVDSVWRDEIPPCIYGIVRREEVIPLP
jgi:hypothetical protein